MAKSTYKDTHKLVAARRGLGSITLPVNKLERVEFQDGSRFGSYDYRTVKVGTRTGEIELWINVDQLMKVMGEGALRSRSKVARRCHGLVLVRAVNVTETKEPQA